MKKKMFFKSYTDNSLSKARRFKDDPVVKNGLAITPVDMNHMLQQGLPIGAQIRSAFADETFTSANDWDIDLSQQRGVDIVDAWEAEQSAKSKIKDFFSKAERSPVEKGGDQ